MYAGMQYFNMKVSLQYDTMQPQYVRRVLPAFNVPSNRSDFNSCINIALYCA